MYVCISLYSLPFTGFESLPESVQTNLSKSPRNSQVIFTPRRGTSSLPGGHWLLYDGTYKFKVGSELPERLRLKYLENFHWYRLRDRTPNGPKLLLGKSGVLLPEPAVLFTQHLCDLYKLCLQKPDYNSCNIFPFFVLSFKIIHVFERNDLWITSTELFISDPCSRSLFLSSGILNVSEGLWSIITATYQARSFDP